MGGGDIWWKTLFTSRLCKNTRAHTEAHKLLLVLSLGPVCVFIQALDYWLIEKTASLRLKAQQLYNRVFHGPGVVPLKLCRAKPNPDDMDFSTTAS